MYFMIFKFSYFLKDHHLLIIVKNLKFIQLSNFVNQNYLIGYFSFIVYLFSFNLLHYLLKFNNTLNNIINIVITFLKLNVII
jgi:hypothetical protein